MNLRPEGRRLGPEPGDELAAGRRGLLHPPGQGQRFNQQKLRLFPPGSAFEEVSGAPQGTDRGGQRPPGQRLGAGLAQQRSGPAAVPGPVRQLDGQLAQAAFQARVAGVQNGERRRGQGPLAGWQHGIEHRLAGQRVPEAEGCAVGAHQQLLDREPERLRHQGRSLPAHGREQFPVEVAAEDGSGLDHRSLRFAEGGQALADRLGERLRQPGRGEQIFHQQRYAFGGGLHPAQELRRCARDAGVDHARHVLVAEPVKTEVKDAGPAPLPAGHFQCGRRPVGAQGKYAQQRLAIKVLAEVLHQGHGVRVGPVQVLQHHDQALRREAPKKLDQRLATDPR